MKYTIEDLKNLPIGINLNNCMRKNTKFLFRHFTNSWNHEVICYQNVDDAMLKAFEIRIDPNAKEISTSTNTYGVSIVHTFDEAYELMYNLLVAEGFIDIEEEFNYEEEAATEPFVSAEGLDIPELD